MRPLNHELLDPPAESRQADGESTGLHLREKPGVLVVDDEHFVRLVVRMGLERSGFDVWLASTGTEAIDVYRAHRDGIGVVLLDVRMPGLDGPKTLDVLRTVNPEVRACFMSGDMGDYGPEELRRRGAASVIAKPFQLEELANVLRLVERGSPVDLLSAFRT